MAMLVSGSVGPHEISSHWRYSPRLDLVNLVALEVRLRLDHRANGGTIGMVPLIMVGKHFFLLFLLGKWWENSWDVFF